jgi:hypothetical protein
MRGHYFVLLIALFLNVVLITGQAQQVNGAKTQEEWWINLSSSPLEFKVFPNDRFLALFNRSGGHVVEFKLGCVIQNKGRARAISKTTGIKTNLAAASASGQQMYFKDVLSYAEETERCRKESAKLAVIEVVFADGAIWMVKE